MIDRLINNENNHFNAALQLSSSEGIFRHLPHNPKINHQTMPSVSERAGQTGQKTL